MVMTEEEKKLKKNERAKKWYWEHREEAKIKRRIRYHEQRDDEEKKIKQKEQNKKWYVSHKEERKSYCQKYHLIYKKTHKGLISKIWGNILLSSRRRNHPKPNFTKEELREFILVKNKDKFEKLYNAWVESRYDTLLVPSINRLNDYLPYTINNIEIITWKENWEKGNICPKTLRAHSIVGKNNNKPILQFSLDGKFIQRYESAAEAGRQLNVGSDPITNMLRGRSKTSYGFRWKYENEKYKEDYKSENK